MGTEKNKPSFRVLMLITSPKGAEQAAALFSRARAAHIYRFHAKGTASSEIMEMLGMGNIDKAVFLTIMPRGFADIMLKRLNKELRLGSPKNGIAFTAPVPDGSRMLLKIKERLDSLYPDSRPQESEESKMNGEDKYSMIVAIVNQGFSEDVMDAARPAGASGGTVIASRRIIDEEATSFWGINLQEEKELVIILSEVEAKFNIMRAIGEKCGLKSEAQGFVFSVPIDNVYGLY